MRITTTLLLSALLASTGCNSDLGIDIQGQRVPVVDMHLHTGKWQNSPPRWQQFLRSTLPGPLSRAPGLTVDSVLSARGIRDNLDNAQVNVGVVFAVYAPRSTGIASNELVRDVVDKYPTRLLGMASLNVEDWDNQGTAQLAALERALIDYHMIGIKLAHPHQHFRLDDGRFEPIFQLAARLDVPVFVHAGNTPAPGCSQDPASNDIGFLETAIRSNPDTTFILGHSGYDFIGKTLGHLATCIRMAQAYPNVRLEASALGSAASDPTGQNLPEVYRQFKAAGLVDRVIYGSDGPQRPGYPKDYLKRSVSAMETAGYSVPQMRAVLSGNFISTFNASLRRVLPQRSALLRLPGTP